MNVDLPIEAKATGVSFPSSRIFVPGFAATNPSLV